MRVLCGIFCLILLINGCLQVSNSRCSTGCNAPSEITEIVQTDTSIEEVNN